MKFRIQKGERSSFTVSTYKGDFPGIFIHLYDRANQQAVVLTIEEANSFHDALTKMLDHIDPD